MPRGKRETRRKYITLMVSDKKPNADFQKKQIKLLRSQPGIHEQITEVPHTWSHKVRALLLGRDPGLRLSVNHETVSGL